MQADCEEQFAQALEIVVLINFRRLAPNGRKKIRYTEIYDSFVEDFEFEQLANKLNIACIINVSIDKKHNQLKNMLRIAELILHTS